MTTRKLTDFVGDSALQPIQWRFKTSLTGLAYYLSSIPTLLRGISNLPLVVAAFAGLPVSKPFVVSLSDGSRYFVRSAMDAWIIKETCLDRQYQRMGVEIEDGWIVIDIGAAFGDFAISVARRNQSSMVYAFEPFPRSFELLERNLKLNDVNNVRALQCAVGATPGPLHLHHPSEEAVQHSTVLSAAGAEGVVVEAVSLEEIFLQHGVSVCDYLKADCEGAEYDILLNASADLLGRIRHLCIEYHDRVTTFSHEDLVRHLEANGFAVTVKVNPVHSNLGLLYAANQQLLGDRSEGDPSGKSAMSMNEDA